MTSKHYGWQKRWRIADETAVHDTGLIVELQPGRIVQAMNREAWAAEMEPKHGPHNVPLMAKRLIREAGQLLTEALDHGKDR